MISKMKYKTARELNQKENKTNIEEPNTFVSPMCSCVNICNFMYIIVLIKCGDENLADVWLVFVVIFLLYECLLYNIIFRYI